MLAVTRMESLQAGIAWQSTLLSRGVICRNVVDIEHQAATCGYREYNLRALTELVLKQQLSKKQQMSNWDLQRLSQAQVKYAACDAWVSREVALYLFHPHGYAALGLPQFDADTMQQSWLQRREELARTAHASPMPGADAQASSKRKKGAKGQKRGRPGGHKDTAAKGQQRAQAPRLPGTGRLPSLTEAGASPSNASP